MCFDLRFAERASWQVGAAASSFSLTSDSARWLVYAPLRCLDSPYSRGVPLGPLTSSLIVLSPVGLVEVCDLRHEGIIRVGIGQEGADGEQHLGDGEGGRPLVLEDVQANRAIAVDVSMVNFRCEGDLRGLEGVVRWEDDVQEEYST